MSYKAEGTPYYSLEILNDIARLRDILQEVFRRAPGDVHPLRYLVMASNKPGVFNLGGDLAMFADAVRTADSRKLRMYAYACVELIHGLTTAFGLPIVTVSVVQGRAFGGGLEAALAEDFIIASPEAQMGVPEVAFNSFPGMGAVSLLSRRLGTARAEEIIASGALYSGRHMFELGVVDVPGRRARRPRFRQAVDGRGRLRSFCAKAVAGARPARAVPGLPHEELVRITDMWVDCALRRDAERHPAHGAACVRTKTTDRLDSHAIRHVALPEPR